MDVVIDGPMTLLDHEGDGYFSGSIDAKPGAVYQFRIDEGKQLYPDPASRFQPDDPHGPSENVDPAAFQWTDSAWRWEPVVRTVRDKLLTPVGLRSLAPADLDYKPR